MNVLRLDRELDTWEGREGTVFAALPYGLLAITAIVSVFARGDRRGHAPRFRPRGGGGGMDALDGHTSILREGAPAPDGLYFIVLVALMAVMVVRRRGSGSSRGPDISSRATHNRATHCAADGGSWAASPWLS